MVTAVGERGAGGSRPRQDEYIVFGISGGGFIADERLVFVSRYIAVDLYLGG